MSNYNLINNNCLDIMDNITKNGFDCLITDPPYGCGKAEWDDNFPKKWYNKGKRISNIVCIITGSSGVKDTIPLVGDDFIDVIAAWNKNGMTRSPIGFGNWLATVVACEKPEQGQNFLKFTVSGDMPKHPSPKPFSFMDKLVKRVTSKGDVVLDPFMGVGTTGMACMKNDRRFVGIEKDEEYFEIAQERIEEAKNTDWERVEGIEEWQQFDGIGEKTATTLYDELGSVGEADMSKLETIDGIGNKTAQSIREEIK